MRVSARFRSPAIVDPATCTCFAVRRAARHVTQAFDRSLAPTGLRITQFALLSRLARSGPRNIQDLAQEMGLDRTTLGRNLRPLERDGLVTIGIDPQRSPWPRAAHHAARRGKAARGAAPTGPPPQPRFRETYGVEQTHSLHATLDEVASLELGARLRSLARFVVRGRLRPGVTFATALRTSVAVSAKLSNGGTTCPI